MKKWVAFCSSLIQYLNVAVLGIEDSNLFSLSISQSYYFDFFVDTDSVGGFAHRHILGGRYFRCIKWKRACQVYGSYEGNKTELSFSEKLIVFARCLTAINSVAFQTTLPVFKEGEFSVVREHEEFVWLHDRYVENEEYAGIIVSN